MARKTIKRYTVEDVENSFGRLSNAIDHNAIVSPEKEQFVNECLLIAARYIQHVGTGIAGYTGLRISNNLAILMTIHGGTDESKRIQVNAYVINGNEVVDRLSTAQVVAKVGANNFAKMLCDTLDNSRVIYEDIDKTDNHIDEYIKTRIKKAKENQPTTH